jgi:hypothetical protein
VIVKASNGKLREELLNGQALSMKEAKIVIES